MCDTTHMEDKLTNEQQVAIANNLGIETNGIELTEEQKTNLAGKLAILAILLDK